MGIEDSNVDNGSTSGEPVQLGENFSDQTVHNLECSSEKFFVTEDNEGDVDDERNQVEPSNHSRPASGESTRSILKDMPSPPISRERRVGSAGDATRLSDSRPSTGQDPKKAVRFAKEDKVEIISARNRSRSAMPRLSSQSKEKTVKTGSCKTDDTTNAARKDDDDDRADPDSGGDRCRRSNSRTVSNRTGSAQGNKTSDTSAKETKSGKQNSNTLYDTRESLDSIVFSKEGILKASVPPRPPSASRPRSRLGAWEDLCKPDNDLTSLAITGSNIDADPDMVETKHLVSYDFLAYNIARKMSLENPRVSSATNKRRKVHKGRPASAHELNRKVQNHVKKEREKINSVKYRRTAGVLPRAASRCRRPLSGISIANTQAGLKVSVNNTSFETDLKVYGNQARRSIKAGMCSKCKMTSEECCYLDESGKVN